MKLKWIFFCQLSLILFGNTRAWCPVTGTQAGRVAGPSHEGGHYLFGLRAGATVELWSENRFAGSDTAAPKPEEERMLIHIWPICEIWCFWRLFSFWQMRNGLGQKWFSFSKTFLGSSVWSAVKPPWAELNVWWLMEKQFKSHHELLVMKGLRVNVLLGTGYTLGRLGGRRDEPPSVSWILSLPAAK